MTPKSASKRRMGNKKKLLTATAVAAKGTFSPMAIPQVLQNKKKKKKKVKADANGRLAAENDAETEGQKGNEESPGLVFPFLDDDNGVESQFDLMQIHISIYNLDGINSTTDEKEQKKRRRQMKLKSSKSDLRITRKRSGFGFMSPSKKTVAKRDATVGSASSIEVLEEQEITGSTKGGIPTTAVVSCHRQVISSGTTMETFLPSSPLTMVSTVGPTSVQYKANWMSEDARRNLEDIEPCTFKIIRAMKRQHYRPGLKIEDVRNYSHETVDLHISLGRGKDLLPLGIASLAVSGDEEGEILMTLPAKPGGGSIWHRGKKARRRRSRGRHVHNNNSFPRDPSTAFQLDGNASLRVGVRVTPYKPEATDEHNDNNNVTQTSNRSTKKALSGSSGDSAKRRDDNNIIIELDDENSLIARFLSEDGNNDDNGCEIRNELEHGCAAIQNTVVSPIAGQDGGCCADPWQILAESLAFWHHPTGGEAAKGDNNNRSNKSTNNNGAPKRLIHNSGSAKESPEQPQSPQKKKLPEEAVMLPPSHLSSVSESTDDTHDEKSGSSRTSVDDDEDGDDNQDGARDEKENDTRKKKDDPRTLRPTRSEKNALMRNERLVI